MARDMFEVIQKELEVRRKNVDEVRINMKAIQEVSNDIVALTKFMTSIKLNSTKILNLKEKIDQDTNEINEAVNLYIDKLRSAIE